MKRKYKQAIIWTIILALITAGLYFLIKESRTSGKYDEFAKCLGEKGATFYGAFWCPHCQNQKAMFGKSAKLLPYIECSTPDGQRQLSNCTQKKIDGYPTWEFSDGSQENGEVPLARLSEKTSCPLPQ